MRKKAAAPVSEIPPASPATPEVEMDAEGNPITPANVVPMPAAEEGEQAPADPDPAGQSADPAPAEDAPQAYQHPRDRFPAIRTEKIELKGVIFDESLQSRVSINEKIVEEYGEIIAERVKRGEEPGFPAVDIFEDPKTGKRYMVGGFHRGQGHKLAKVKEILANIHLGTKEEARLFAASENATHGLHRTQQDKRKALKMVLDSPESAAMSNVEVSLVAGVSEAMVRDHRTVAQTASVKVVKKGGKVVKMDTSRIGKKGGKAPKATKTEKASKTASPETKKAGDGSAPATDEKGRPTLSLDESGEAALKKIVKALGDQGDGFEEAFRTGSLQMTRKDIMEMSETSPDRIRRAYPLIADKGMKPKAAYAFLDMEVSDATRVEELKNLAITGKGSLTLPDWSKLKSVTRTGFYAKLGGFDVMVLAPERM